MRINQKPATARECALKREIASLLRLLEWCAHNLSEPARTSPIGHRVTEVITKQKWSNSYASGGSEGDPY